MIELAFARFSLAAGSFTIAATPAKFDPAPPLPPGDS
jgi:hypothetical protein